MIHHHFVVDMDVVLFLRIADRHRYQGEIECICDINHNVYLNIFYAFFPTFHSVLPTLVFSYHLRHVVWNLKTGF